jgi:hypothetical protein
MSMIHDPVPSAQLGGQAARQPRGLAMIKSMKAFLLAGASALAILASAAEANAETLVFTGPEQPFTASVSGEYAVDVLGARREFD